MSGVVLGDDNITINGKILEVGNSVGLTPKVGANPIVTTIIRYPITLSPPLPSNNNLSWYDNGYTIIVKVSDIPLGPGVSVNKIFNNVVNDVNNCYHSQNIYNASSPFQYQGSTTFRGNSGIALYIDLGRSIIPTYMALAPRDTEGNLNMIIGAPGRFKIYASNVFQDWNSTTSTTWVLIHDQTSSLSYSYRTSTDFNFNSNSSPTTPYRYYVIVTTNLTGSYMHLMIGEWQIYGPEINIMTYERMYPPIRNVSSTNHQITGEVYGNGLYVTSFSSLFSQDPAFLIFGTQGHGHWGDTQRYITPNGTFRDTLPDNIVSGYNGDWIKIKFPVAINLTRYALQILSIPSRAPQNFKIYGSNNETNWIELTHETNAIYVNNLYERTITTLGTYNSFGLVVNKVNGGDNNAYILMFDEWFIYGTEILNKSINDDFSYIPFVNTGGNQTQYNITFPENTECDILVVGGGGGGGGGHGGGGGAGQLVLIHNAILNGKYDIIVGKGGIRGTNPNSAFGIEPTKGMNSSFHTVIAEGGGATGKGILKNGGSGSGGDAWLSELNLGDRDKGIKNSTVDTYSTGTVYSKGNDGGTGGRGQSGTTGINDPGQGGGGGGAGTAGGNGADWNVNASPGNGGDGLSGISEIGYDFKTMFGTNFGKVETDNLIYFAGGGGGGGWVIEPHETNSTGGKGGGGAGGLGTVMSNAVTIISNGLNAKDNTGSGGGGGSANRGEGGNGGSGIVIIRYKIIKTNFDAQWTYSSTNPNVYHLGNVGIGTTNPTSALSVVGSIDIDGSISALYKTFKIEHPLNINKWLYHGCVEGPRFDNIYRGKKITIDGKCEIDIDKECNTVGGMSEGTFDALNTSCQLYVMNNQTYDRVNGKIDSGKITINCENITDNIEIDWLVIGERKDEQIANVPYTDDEGKLICEHNI